MNTQLSPKDWQLLSEYVDGQLSARQKEKLEQRLQADVGLRQGEEEMRQTRAILRSVPRLKVPHNFTLTRAMASEALLRSPWVRVLSYSSVLSLALVIITVLFQLLPAAVPLASQAPMVAMKGARAEAAPTQGAAATEPPIINWLPATGMGGGGPGPNSSGVQPGAPTAAERLAVPKLTPQPTMMVENQNQLPKATPEVPSGPSIAQTPAPTENLPATEMNQAPTQAAGVEKESAGAPSQDNGPILGLPPKEEAGQIQAYSAPDQPIKAAKNPVNFLIVFQVGMVVVALATGLAAILLRRKTLA
jgi:anti-sigma factor RsiW